MICMEGQVGIQAITEIFGMVLRTGLSCFVFAFAKHMRMHDSCVQRIFSNAYCQDQDVACPLWICGWYNRPSRSKSPKGVQLHWPRPSPGYAAVGCCLYINIPPQTALVYHGSMTACPLHSPDMVAVTNIRRLYLDAFMDIQNRSFFRDQFSELRLSPSSFFGLQSYLEDQTSPLLLLNDRRVPLYDNHTSSLYKWKWEQSILTWSKGLFTVEPYRSNPAVSKRTRMPYDELVSRVKSDISHWEHLVRVVQDSNISTDRQVEFHTPTNNNFPLGMSAIAQALGLQEEVKALYPPYTPKERNLYLPLQLPTTPRTECYTLVTTQAPAFMLRGSRCILPMPVVVVHDISDEDDTTDEELNNMLHAPPPPPNDVTWDPEATVAGLLTEFTQATKSGSKSPSETV